MSTQNKEIVLGDVVKYEDPHELCRVQKNVSRVLAATVGLIVGECMEPDTDVAQIHTADSAGNTADGGTFKLGYKGQWTTALAWNVSAADAKTAFELLSLVTDTITFSASPMINGTTATWTTAGQKVEIDVDGRLLLDDAVVMDDATIPVSTIGSTTAEMVIIATGTNCSGILLEKVTLADLKAGNNLRRPFLVKGTSIVDGDNLFALAAQLTDSKTALAALDITIRTEPSIYQSGPPTS